jgi:hypothetical protein
MIRVFGVAQLLRQLEGFLALANTVFSPGVNLFQSACDNGRQHFVIIT